MMTSEVEERPRLVTGAYRRHRRQWVNLQWPNNFENKPETDNHKIKQPILKKAIDFVTRKILSSAYMYVKLFIMLMKVVLSKIL